MQKRGFKTLQWFQSFIKYSNDVHDIYENIEEYNPNKKMQNLNKNYI